ncbi:MAG: hypothetical protein K9M11_01475 [Candidatus Pacebacteria bacterium]|nr:hypothetical protein [Candidatus Paceibacterota bacterium]
MFRSIGLVIGLIALRVFLPDVFHAFNHTAVSFFHLADKVFAFIPNALTFQIGSVGHVGSILDGANFVPSSAPLPNFK